MRIPSQFYRSELLKTLIQYFSVALSFVPAGIAYSFVAINRGENIVALLALLLVGFVTAQLAWHRTSVALARWGVRVSEETAAPSALFVFPMPRPTVASTPVIRIASLAVAVTIVSASVSSMSRGLLDQGRGTVGYARIWLVTS